MTAHLEAVKPLSLFPNSYLSVLSDLCAATLTPPPVSYLSVLSALCAAAPPSPRVPTCQCSRPSVPQPHHPPGFLPVSALGPLCRSPTIPPGSYLSVLSDLCAAAPPSPWVPTCQCSQTSVPQPHHPPGFLPVSALGPLCRSPRPSPGFIPVSALGPLCRSPRPSPGFIPVSALGPLCRSPRPPPGSYLLVLSDLCAAAPPPPPGSYLSVLSDLCAAAPPPPPVSYLSVLSDLCAAAPAPPPGSYLSVLSDLCAAAPAHPQGSYLSVLSDLCAAAPAHPPGSYLSVLSDLCAAAPAGLEAEASDMVAESLASPTVDDGSSFGGSSSLSTGFGSTAGGASPWKYERKFQICKRHNWLFWVPPAPVPLKVRFQWDLFARQGLRIYLNWSFQTSNQKFNLPKSTCPDFFSINIYQF